MEEIVQLKLALANKDEELSKSIKRWQMGTLNHVEVLQEMQEAHRREISDMKQQFQKELSQQQERCLREISELEEKSKEQLLEQEKRVNRKIKQLGQVSGEGWPPCLGDKGGEEKVNKWIREKQKMVKRVETYLKRLISQPVFKNANEDPNRSAGRASRSPSRDGKQPQRRFNTE
ncbi:unnamed protein product, partial [Tetraodon nigroviridis]